VGAREEIRARLTGPGGPFELATEDVLGQRMQVFKTRPRSLREVLAASAARGDAEYLVHGERRITYAEHLALVASLARALGERYGVGKGDRVAILAENCTEWILAFWATMSLGGIAAALNGWWTADEIEYGVRHSDPKLLIGDRKRLARVQGSGLGVPTVEIESGFEALLAHAPGAGLPSVPIAEDDPAVILYTSGTTGRPKGALSSHRGLVGFIQTGFLGGAERLMAAAQSGAAPARPMGPPVSLVTAPLFHLSGLYGMTVTQLAAGGKLVLRSGRFDPEDVLRLIEKERVTAWSALGSMGPRVLSSPALGRYDVSSVRVIGFGGAPVSPTTQSRMREAFPNAATNVTMGYGSSESVTSVAAIGGADYLERPTSTGTVSCTMEIEIRDSEDKAVPAGVQGEIHIRSPYLMLGYWRDPEATARAIKPGRWLATGDIGHLDREGYLYINSRARDMILRSAENITPVEIEYRLEAHPSVAEAAVVGVDHEELGQEVKAIVVPVEGARIDTGELARWVGEKLAAYKVPTLWEVRREPLPRNASGKVLKSVLTGEARSALVED
jgi:acyl-CoA synthetase (AMP-forming)/AMP-acid ligase II